MNDAPEVLEDSTDEVSLSGLITRRQPPADPPSNEVHARVGNGVLLAARQAVRRGMRPEDIIRDIREEHGVRLNIGELRLLLASRSRTQDITRARQTYGHAPSPDEDEAE